jgi:hypothetical protein
VRRRDSHFHDLWESKLGGEYKKTGGNKERAFQISPSEGGGYRVAIMNNSGSERERLYFQLSQREVRQLAITVLDYLRAYEVANALAAILGKEMDVDVKKEKEKKGY